MINMYLGFAGHFSYAKGKMDGEGNVLTREEIPGHRNLILNAGLQRMGGSADWLAYLHLGSGIQAPTPTQTALQFATYVGNTMAPGGDGAYGINLDDPERPYHWYRRVYRVTPRGENRTYSEVGVGWSTSALYCRALIKDPMGNPNTITTLADEYLDVTYEVRMYIPIGDATFVVNPTGDDVEPRTITVRASRLGVRSSYLDGWQLAYYSTGTPLIGNNSDYSHCRFFDGVAGTNSQNPFGNVVGGVFNASSGVRTSDTSVTFSFTRDLPDNVGTIRTIQIGQIGYSFQAQLDPPFVKDNESKFMFSYSISWGRDGE